MYKLAMLEFPTCGAGRCGVSGARESQKIRAIFSGNGIFSMHKGMKNWIRIIR
ncbi:hypothetical protein MmTuc01_0678 [Methanosarcina mazei Tuc01]|uniref:Uncharacterized protein n=1 Tax=Methanosarcina mazei Tuc01 TaxID=1236903 RepID=M1PV37_METMZ|nr:hypothetical protein MmTuc01_0678 [Methanosarcina mazei Tuc01]